MANPLPSTVTESQSSEKRLLSEPERAWLAAAIDGEGSLFLSQRKMRGPSGRVFVFNTNLNFINKAADIMGLAVGIRPRVYIHNNKVAGLNQKPCYAVALRGTHCKELIVQISSYLIIKKQRAETILETNVTTNSEHMANLNGKVWPALIESGKFARRGHIE